MFLTWNALHYNTEACLEPLRTFKLELFAKVVNDLQLSILTNCSILEVWQGPEYASDVDRFPLNIEFCSFSCLRYASCIPLAPLFDLFCWATVNTGQYHAPRQGFLLLNQISRCRRSSQLINALNIHSVVFSSTNILNTSSGPFKWNA